MNMIRRLPVISGVVAIAGAKRNAEEMKKIMKRGVRSGNWLRPRLARSTVLSKVRSGFPYTKEPLLATGIGKGTMIGSLQVRPTKRGFIFAPYGYHKRSGLPAKVVWHIHEYGAVFRTADGGTTRIPARKAFKRTFDEFTRQRVAQATTKEMKAAIRKRLRASVR